MKWLDKFQEGGPIVKQRKGVRPNPDGTHSSHLMRTEMINDSTWVAFPSLFQNEDSTWVDMSKQAEKDWYPIYEEAKKRGEVYNFGKDAKKAIEFGEGSWKKQVKEKGGTNSTNWLNKY